MTSSIDAPYLNRLVSDILSIKVAVRQTDKPVDGLARAAAKLYSDPYCLSM